ncbi:MAG: 50S ribosomal protein L31 [Proteobacteria bacterium]|uniref:50S ribosomal protein L31 n=1 Tax=Candidatus Enterousia excrementavium TaxID=2840789 RepID=A0A940IA61_9PROT|nr:50S ribosomal protein L31 [Candidatus Enterousia excrementavium]
MKKGIHPEYYEINVTMTNGKTVKMYSSVNKDLVLSTDNLNHSAWTGQRNNASEKGQRAAEFKNKFAGFKF